MGHPVCLSSIITAKLSAANCERLNSGRTLMTKNAKVAVFLMVSFRLGVFYDKNYILYIE